VWGPRKAGGCGKKRVGKKRVHPLRKTDQYHDV